MRLGDRPWSVLWFSVLNTFAACAGELVHFPDADLEGRALGESEANVASGTLDAEVQAAPDAGTYEVVDAGTEHAPSAGRLTSSSAIGAKPGNFCSPVEGEGMYWALCEARRGLRCQPPLPDQPPAPSTCACAPGATFDRVACSSDWGDDGGVDAAAEVLGPSTAQGAKVGDQCIPGAFPSIPWALCDARRGLECRKPPVRRGTQDVAMVCLCPEGATFSHGVCTAL